MTTATRIKLVLAVLGLSLFAAGVRFENERLRWGAVVVMALAFLARFVRRDRDEKE